MIATSTDYLTMIEMMPPGTVLTFSEISWDEMKNSWRTWLNNPTTD